MKPWSRHEPLDVDVSGTTQFEGRTAEEAVARARAALGDSGALRCWKTRRGGVGGFFAKEVFVAGLTPPPGSETTRGRASRARPGPQAGASGHPPVPDAEREDGAQSAPVLGPFRQDAAEAPTRSEDHLSALVEATSDQVSLGSLAIPAEAFDEVLAEAQAALTRERGGSDVPVPGEPASPEVQAVITGEPDVFEHELVPPDDGQAAGPPAEREDTIASRRPVSSEPGERSESARPAKKATRSKAKAGRTPPAPRSSAATTHGQRSRAARIPDLRPGLRSLGVPDIYVPRGQRPSLDQLASAMGTLPVAPALPTRSGAVVAVIASDRDLERTVDLVSAELSLGQRDVLRSVASPGADLVGPADVPSAEVERLGRRIARRRACGRTSLLALQAEPGTPLGRDLCRLLDQATPDYVLAAVGAACKRVDVEHLIGELLRVDALTLWDLSRTRTPAELLGLLPIAFVDGEPSSSLGWTLTLAGRATERSGR
jgi:hypothetical protein